MGKLMASGRFILGGLPTVAEENLEGEYGVGGHPASTMPQWMFSFLARGGSNAFGWFQAKRVLTGIH